MNDERVTLVSLCEARGITSEAKHVRFEGRETNGTILEWPHDLWSVTIAFQGKSYVSDFKTGIGHRVPSPHVERHNAGKTYYDRIRSEWASGDVEAVEKHMLVFRSTGTGKDRKAWTPSTADVVYCLASDAFGAAESFESWCSDFGNSSDSIKALETYRACQKTRDALLKLFGGALLEELAQAEH